MKRSYGVTFFIVAGILVMAGCLHVLRDPLGDATLSMPYVLKPEESSRWFFADTPSPQAVVLLIHGLNQKPSMWKEMVASLNRLGAHVYRLTLKGHGGGPFEDMKSVTADAWRQNVIDAYNDMEAHFAHVPKILVGYSTGALVALDYQLTKGAACFNKQILFAPAIALQDYTYLVKPLTYVTSYLSSRSPEPYRANMEGTAMAAYRAMFDLLDDLENTDDFQAVNSETLVFINPDDELIDYKGLVEFTETRDLDNWTLAPVLNQKSTLVPASHHLIIDSMSLGPDGWAFVTSAMADFMGQGEAQRTDDRRVVEINPDSIGFSGLCDRVAR